MNVINLAETKECRRLKRLADIRHWEQDKTLAVFDRIRDLLRRGCAK